VGSWQLVEIRGQGLSWVLISDF